MNNNEFIYNYIINNEGNEILKLLNFNKNYFDIIQNYYILTNLKYIIYDNIIYNDNLNFFKLYNHYFLNCYNYIGVNSFKNSIIELLKNFNIGYIYKLHKNFINYAKYNLSKFSILPTFMFIHLTELYDYQFIKRLSIEEVKIKFNYNLIKYNLTNKEVKKVKSIYQHINIEDYKDPE